MWLNVVDFLASRSQDVFIFLFQEKVRKINKVKNMIPETAIQEDEDEG